jgi:hypothetical protein
MASDHIMDMDDQRRSSRFVELLALAGFLAGLAWIAGMPFRTRSLTTVAFSGTSGVPGWIGAVFPLFFVVVVFVVGRSMLKRSIASVYTDAEIHQQTNAFGKSVAELGATIATAVWIYVGMASTLASDGVMTVLSEVSIAFTVLFVGLYMTDVGYEKMHS